jgi:hypothetical protein
MAVEEYGNIADWESLSWSADFQAKKWNFGNLACL